MGVKNDWKKLLDENIRESLDKELADEMEIDLRKKAKKDPDYWGPILKAYLAQK